LPPANGKDVGTCSVDMLMMLLKVRGWTLQSRLDRKNVRKQAEAGFYVQQSLDT
jgi:hypothetical protein